MAGAALESPTHRGKKRVCFADVGENNNDETARGDNHQITADWRERCVSVGVDRLMVRPLTRKEEL